MGGGYPKSFGLPSGESRSSSCAWYCNAAQPEPWANTPDSLNTGELWTAKDQSSPFHLNLCRWERGDPIPSASLGFLSALHLAGCHRVTLPAWSLCEQSQGWHSSSWAGRAGRTLAHTATAPSSCQKQPQLLLDPAPSSCQNQPQLLLDPAPSSSPSSCPDPSEEALLHTLSPDGVTNAGCCMTWDTTGTLDSYWRQLCCFMPMSAFAALCCAEPSPAVLQAQAHWEMMLELQSKL